MAATSPKLPDGRVSRAQRLREERRIQVLATARQLFAERGYHATSIGEIISSAEIARGTFYLYFESKRAIFAELLDDLFATVALAVRRIDVAPGAAPPLEQMGENVRRILGVLADERHMTRVLLRGVVGIDDEFDRKLSDFYARVARLIEQGLRLGMQIGLVRSCDPALTSYCILGSAKEIVDRALVAGHLERGSEELERVGRELMQFNLYGVFR